MLHLTIVRHGETVGKSSERLYGSTDIALSNIGTAQMHSVAKYLAGNTYDHIFTSPMQRSIIGAEIISQSINYKTKTMVKGFKEVDFGIWEGMTIPEVKQQYPEAYEEWILKKNDFSYPEGDIRTEFINRVAEASLESFSTIEGTALAVLHKGVMKVVLSTLLNKNLLEFKTYPIELASIHRLTRDKGNWQLTETNYIDHLGQYRIETSR